MKNIIYLFIALGTAGAFVALRPAPQAAENPAGAAAPITAPPRASASAPAPAEAPRAGPDLSPGAATLPYDSALANVEAVNEEEVEKEITALDARLEKERWAERANRGALSAEEMLRLRGLLHHRNRLFERKLDLAGA